MDDKIISQPPFRGLKRLLYGRNADAATSEEMSELEQWSEEIESDFLEAVRAGNDDSFLSQTDEKLVEGKDQERRVDAGNGHHGNGQLEEFLKANGRHDLVFRDGDSQRRIARLEARLSSQIAVAEEADSRAAAARKQAETLRDQLDELRWQSLHYEQTYAAMHKELNNVKVSLQEAQRQLGVLNGEVAETKYEADGLRESLLWEQASHEAAAEKLDVAEIGLASERLKEEALEKESEAQQKQTAELALELAQVRFELQDHLKLTCALEGQKQLLKTELAQVMVELGKQASLAKSLESDKNTLADELARTLQALEREHASSKELREGNDQLTWELQVASGELQDLRAATQLLRESQGRLSVRLDQSEKEREELSAVIQAEIDKKNRLWELASRRISELESQLKHIGGN